jgi:uncharacterized protein (TIRG00374 family)
MWIGLSLVLLFLSHFVRAWRWRFLLNPMKENIAMRPLFSGVMVGFMMNNVLPRAGELARPYAISRLEAIPASGALGSIVVERLLDVAAFLVIVALLPTLYHGPLEESFPWLHQAGVILVIVTVLLLAILTALMVRRDWTNRLVVRCEALVPLRFRERFDGAVHSFLDALLFLKRPREVAWIAISSVVIWVLYGLMTYAGLLAFALDVKVGLAGAFVVLAISSVGIAIPTPGGTGSYHVLTTQALTRLFAVGANAALSFATVTHAASFISVTIVGLIYLLKDHVGTDAIAALRGEKSA